LRDVDEAGVGGGRARAEEALLDQRDADAGTSQIVGDAQAADSAAHDNHVGALLTPVHARVVDTGGRTL